MTQDKNEGSENLNWMEIAETDAINEVRHNGQRLPFIAAAVSLLIIGGGAVFAQTNNESPAQAEETSVSQSSQSSQTSQTSQTLQTPSTVGDPAVTPGGVPVIPNVAPGVNKYEDDDEYEDDDDEYEDDEDDDDDEYEDDEDEDDD
jgi:hypothetical protein